LPVSPPTNGDHRARMFVLDDAKADTGCMRLVRGSHKRGLVSHFDASGKFVGRCSNPADYEPDEQAGNATEDREDGV